MSVRAAENTRQRGTPLPSAHARSPRTKSLRAPVRVIAPYGEDAEFLSELVAEQRAAKRRTHRLWRKIVAFIPTTLRSVTALMLFVGLIGFGLAGTSDTAKADGEVFVFGTFKIGVWCHNSRLQLEKDNPREHNFGDTAGKDGEVPDTTWAQYGVSGTTWEPMFLDCMGGLSDRMISSVAGGVFRIPLYASAYTIQFFQWVFTGEVIRMFTSSDVSGGTPPLDLISNALYEGFFLSFVGAMIILGALVLLWRTLVQGTGLADVLSKVLIMVLVWAFAMIWAEKGSEAVTYFNDLSDEVVSVSFSAFSETTCRVTPGNFDEGACEVPEGTEGGAGQVACVDSAMAGDERKIVYVDGVDCIGQVMYHAMIFQPWAVGQVGPLVEKGDDSSDYSERMKKAYAMLQWQAYSRDEVDELDGGPLSGSDFDEVDHTLDPPSLIADVFQMIVETLKDLLPEWAVDVLKDISSFLKDVGEAIVDFFKDLWDSVTDWLSDDPSDEELANKVNDMDEEFGQLFNEGGVTGPWGCPKEHNRSEQLVNLMQLYGSTDLENKFNLDATNSNEYLYNMCNASRALSADMPRLFGNWVAIALLFPPAWPILNSAKDWYWYAYYYMENDYNAFASRVDETSSFNIMTGEHSSRRLYTALMALLAGLAIAWVVLIIAMAYLVLQVATVAFAIVAPIAALIGLIPMFGTQFFLKWAQMFLGTYLKRIGLALFVGFLMTIYTMVLVMPFPWTMQTAMLILIGVVVFAYRKKIMQAAGSGAVVGAMDGASGTALRKGLAGAGKFGKNRLDGYRLKRARYQGALAQMDEQYGDMLSQKDRKKMARKASKGRRGKFDRKRVREQQRSMGRVDAVKRQSQAGASSGEELKATIDQSRSDRKDWKRQTKDDKKAWKAGGKQGDKPKVTRRTRRHVRRTAKRGNFEVARDDQGNISSASYDTKKSTRQFSQRRTVERGQKKGQPAPRRRRRGG